MTNDYSDSRYSDYFIMPRSLPEALRMCADALEMKELIIKQRHESVCTKTFIRNESASINAVDIMQWFDQFFDMRYPNIYLVIENQLSKISARIGHSCKMINDVRYGEVKAYHISVIEHFKYKLMTDLNMLRRFRKLAF